MKAPRGTSSEQKPADGRRTKVRRSRSLSRRASPRTAGKVIDLMAELKKSLKASAAAARAGCPGHVFEQTVLGLRCSKCGQPPVETKP